MWTYTTPGIPDDRFCRGSLPMTKEEVRVVTLAKARLKPDSIIYDIGAGTGSLTVEAALQAPGGRVYALEREEEGIELIKLNCSRFGAANVEVIQAEAPAGMEGLPKSQAILVGGSGGKLAEIIAASSSSLVSGGRIVINAVTLETLGRAQQALGENGFEELDIVSLAVTRWPRVGRSFMAKALNPVFIISAALRS